jgi:hypothetical protein
MQCGESTTNAIPDPIPKPANAASVAKTKCPTNHADSTSTLIFLDHSTIPKIPSFTAP